MDDLDRIRRDIAEDVLSDLSEVIWLKLRYRERNNDGE